MQLCSNTIQCQESLEPWSRHTLAIRVKQARTLRATTLPQYCTVLVVYRLFKSSHIGHYSEAGPQPCVGTIYTVLVVDGLVKFSQILHCREAGVAEERQASPETPHMGLGLLLTQLLALQQLCLFFY